jgi:hypothetical protein
MSATTTTPMLTNLRLPDRPPRRLAVEAVAAWRLRHLDKEYVDYELAEWPVIRGMILALLRHQLTEVDEKVACLLPARPGLSGPASTRD